MNIIANTAILILKKETVSVAFQVSQIIYNSPSFDRKTGSQVKTKKVKLVFYILLD